MLFAYDSIAATQKLGHPVDILDQTIVLYTVQLQKPFLSFRGHTTN